MFQYDNKIIPLFSSFSDEDDDFIMDKLIKDKHNLEIMCKGYKHSLFLIDRMKKSLSNLKD